nr:TonB family protein [uncultured Holophaga sp.]
MNGAGLLPALLALSLESIPPIPPRPVASGLEEPGTALATPLLGALDSADEAIRQGEFVLALGILAKAVQDPGADGGAVRSRFLQLASQGVPGAFYWVGRCCEVGWGTPTDSAQARAWFEKGARAGDPDCLLHLAWMLDWGQGLPADAARARRLRAQAGFPEPTGPESLTRGGSSGGSGQILGKELTPVRVRLRPPAPPYPMAAKRARIQGTVVVQILIGADGVPRGVHTLAGPAELRDAVEAYAFRWRFWPSLQAGRAISARFMLTMPFRLH